MAKEGAQFAGRKRTAPDRARVHKRVAGFLCEQPAACRQEVAPLNAGFFALEAMRHASVSAAKERAKRKGKVRGK